jgi:hypothetical protein
LKQRYRQLTLEFHPDSVRNNDLPKVTINSLMANLTGTLSLYCTFPVTILVLSYTILCCPDLLFSFVLCPTLLCAVLNCALICLSYASRCLVPSFFHFFKYSFIFAFFMIIPFYPYSQFLILLSFNLSHSILIYVIPYLISSYIYFINFSHRFFYYSFELGAFNFLSGINSLSSDGTLLSLSSPWGSRYKGGGGFESATTGN